jgi:hypothetical protein
MSISNAQTKNEFEKRMNPLQKNLSVHSRIDVEAKQKKHQILDCLFAMLENKKVVIRGQILPSVLSPLTVNGFLESGWTDQEIYEIEKCVINDIGNRNWAEILQDIPRNLANNLRKVDLDHLIFEQRVVAVPNNITNSIICDQLATRYSEDELESCGCFVSVIDSEHDDPDCKFWRLDVGDHLIRNGFLMPKIEDGFIAGIWAFRHPNDQKPFLLRARAPFIVLSGGEHGEVF